MDVWVYMLKCADASYYVGSHRGLDPGVRVAQHQAGEGGDYTSRRRPAERVWAENFVWATDAIACERQLKGWSRATKEALILGDWQSVKSLAKRRAGRALPPKTADKTTSNSNELNSLLHTEAQAIAKLRKTQ